MQPFGVLKSIIYERKNNPTNYPERARYDFYILKFTAGTAAAETSAAAGESASAAAASARKTASALVTAAAMIAVIFVSKSVTDLRAF